MNISQLMKTHVVILPATASLDSAADRMEEAGIRHLPIADGSGRLVGIVSQRDLSRALDIMRTAEGKRQPLHLGDIMRTDVLKVPPELPAHEAATMMIEHKVGMLPVVDREQRIVGIVTQTDFVEVAREALLGVPPEKRASA